MPEKKMKLKIKDKKAGSKKDTKSKKGADTRTETQRRMEKELEEIQEEEDEYSSTEEQAGEEEDEVAGDWSEDEAEEDESEREYSDEEEEDSDEEDEDSDEEQEYSDEEEAEPAPAPKSKPKPKAGEPVKFVRDRNPDKKVIAPPPKGFYKKAAKAKAERAKQKMRDSGEKEVFRITLGKGGEHKQVAQVTVKERKKKRPTDPRLERSRKLMEDLALMDDVKDKPKEKTKSEKIADLYQNTSNPKKVHIDVPGHESLPRATALRDFTAEREDGSHTFVSQGETLVLVTSGENMKWWTGYVEGQPDETGEFLNKVVAIVGDENHSNTAAAPDTGRPEPKKKKKVLEEGSGGAEREARRRAGMERLKKEQAEAARKAEEEQAAREAEEQRQRAEKHAREEELARDAEAAKQNRAAGLAAQETQEREAREKEAQVAKQKEAAKLAAQETQEREAREKEAREFVNKQRAEEADKRQREQELANRLASSSEADASHASTAVLPPATSGGASAEPSSHQTNADPVAEAALAAEPNSSPDKRFQELLQEGLEFVYRKRYDDAIHVFKQSRKFDPVDPTPAYNLACCYSLKRDIESGIRWMTVAIDLGLDYEDLAQDPDLENMFDHPKFQELWNRMRNLSDDMGVPQPQHIQGSHWDDPSYSPASKIPPVPHHYPGSSVGDGGPESLESPDTVFEAQLNDGVEAVARGDHEGAVKCFSNCLRLRPEDAACAYNLTCCYALMSDTGSALQWFRKAVDWGLAGLPDLDPARDSDLRNLMDDKNFLQLVDELKEKQRALHNQSTFHDGSPPPSSFTVEGDATSSPSATNSASDPFHRSLDPQAFATNVGAPPPRAHSSAPVGFDQKNPQATIPTGVSSATRHQSPQAAWGLSGGLESHPQDVLGRHGPGSLRQNVLLHTHAAQHGGHASVADIARVTSTQRRWQTASNELPHDPEEWSLGHVSQWLKQMGLAKYIEKFEEQDIRGDVLLDLTAEECETSLGIKVLGHRKLLLKSLEFLKRQSKHDPMMPIPGTGY